MRTLDAAPTVVILMSERPFLRENAKRKDGGKRQSAELHGPCILGEIRGQRRNDARDDSAATRTALANHAPDSGDCERSQNRSGVGWLGRYNLRSSFRESDRAGNALCSFV